jgi:predicted nicotinamide N-methyase
MKTMIDVIILSDLFFKKAVREAVASKCRKELSINSQL